MPAAFKTLIDAYYTTHGYFAAHFSDCAYYAYDLSLQATAHSWDGMAVDFLNLMEHFGHLYEHVMTDSYNLRTQMRTMMYWANTNWPSGGTINMAAILSAMLLATNDELTQFVGITDAYKVAIWNQPFNAEFYSALARGFTP